MTGYLPGAAGRNTSARNTTPSRIGTGTSFSTTIVGSPIEVPPCLNDDRGMLNDEERQSNQTETAPLPSLSLSLLSVCCRVQHSSFLCVTAPCSHHRPAWHGR